MGIARRYVWLMLIAGVACWLVWLLAAHSQRRQLVKRVALDQLQRQLAASLSEYTRLVDALTASSPNQPPTREALNASWQRAWESSDVAAVAISDRGDTLLRTSDELLPRTYLNTAVRSSLGGAGWQSATWRAASEESLTIVARRIDSQVDASDSADIPGMEAPAVVVAWAYGWLERELAEWPQQNAWGLGWPLIGIALLLLAAQGRRMAQQTRGFAQAVVRVSAGDLDQKIDADERQGVGLELSDALDQLKARIERRQASEESDRDRTAAVLASMVEGVLAVDHEMRITMANHAAIQLLALPRDVVGKYVSAVVRIPQFEDAILRSRRKNGPIRTELETVGPVRKTLSMRVTPLRNHPSAELAIVLHDVTELRRLETMRRDFVANVSHELKTPLASIKAFAETLRMGAIDNAAVNRQFLGQIETQTQLLEQQIHDLLHLARVESGRTAFELSPVDLNQAARECWERFGTEATQRTIELNYTPASEPVIAMADREALGTVLDNLMSNAIRYTKPGGRVEIRSGLKDGHPFVAVSDTGIGIAAEHHDRIFERFYRVDRARSRDVGGTGLGLAIVKHTVQALGGRIGLTSRLGKGSTFQVFLPTGQDLST